MLYKSNFALEFLFLACGTQVIKLAI